MGKLPRIVNVLAGVAMVVGGLGGGRALSEVAGYLGSHDGFVNEKRRELEVRSRFSGDLPSEVVQKVGDQLGERAWARRATNLPLSLANLLLSTMLFVGALRALARSKWGHGAWQFAALLNIPFTLLQTVVQIVEAGDGREANAALIAAMHKSMPVETMSLVQLMMERVMIGAGAAILCGFYVACAVVLRRPHVAAQFTLGGPEAEE